MALTTLVLAQPKVLKGLLKYSLPPVCRVGALTLWSKHRIEFVGTATRIRCIDRPQPAGKGGATADIILT
jgi:hypothetical protein